MTGLRRFRFNGQTTPSPIAHLPADAVLKSSAVLGGSLIETYASKAFADVKLGHLIPLQDVE